jgi:bidirectional [NiFe] hydrogenase diaphorase subunit
LPKVTIDDKQVSVPKETTIMQAAQKAGVWIPTLCYSPVLTNHGACRICMVEVDRGDGRKRLVTACNYPIRDDVTVSVESDRAVKARQGVMKLLLARSPESLELKQLAERMGVDGTPYPTVTESQRSCILCGLCATVCEEAIGVSAIDFAGRGVNRVIAAPFRQPSEDCIACGACAAVCPVGTIQVRIHEDTGEAEISPFKTRRKLLVCEECGTRMVTEPVAQQMFSRVDFDWKEFRSLARICPECRRKKAAGSLGFIQGLIGAEKV